MIEQNLQKKDIKFKILIILIISFLFLNCSQKIIQGYTYIENYNLEYTSNQLDSLYEVDNIPNIHNWDSIPTVNIGYIYLYRDSTRVYRIYKSNDKYNVTKRTKL